jgi:hypothetical protein
LRLTRIYLDTVSGSTPQKSLYWQRRPASSPTSGAWTDAGVRTVKLATSVVNNSIPNPTPTPATSYTAIFTYYYRDGSGNLQNADTITANLATIISVRVRLIADVNQAHAPKYIDLSTTLRPRNANLN